MACFDVFNGDADGICALHQLRLAEPRDCTLVTGVKRDIALLNRVAVTPGDRVTALDISLDKNLAAVERLLEQGARITYVDHHAAPVVPNHPALDAVLDPDAGVCTSLLVDRMLDGRYRAWAVTAAFGDNLADSARRAAAPLRLTEPRLAALRELGECLNYNAYGDSVDDLFIHPAELYRRLHAYTDPFDFIAAEPVLGTLREGYQADLALAGAARPEWSSPDAAAYILPDRPWSRRVGGTFGNRLAEAEPDIAHAVLTRRREGGYIVSVRSPRNRPEGADALCRQFESGGGRRAAAGINVLPEQELTRFLTQLGAVFARQGA